ncbi:C2H2 and C2HC zinc finger [Venustampulla echinocandica]|uniref:C2H2 and C2HC zinc finger n=1 Tax=Venustampulla echinocandica TaxID=2656787 RepID=A0A370TT89_9HELO|nr:C2H2 and C2HC zinc finger [Venustampulla echinocandica]RDL38751.1 C2H2 and C2HC zinc finger [Venustampulla echinocandica]
MILEEQRFLHEDLERLEQAISDRVAEEPRQVRERLNRDHQIAGFLDRIQDQSKRLLDIYNDADGVRTKEIQSISTGEPLKEFYKQLADIKSFHQKYPNEPVENLERAYKRKAPAEGEPIISEVDNMFTGEEAFGRFLDLTTIHELYLNLPGIKRLTYLQYLDAFDSFIPPQCNVKRPDKMTDQYFNYVGQLAQYLEGFMRRTRPLENLDKLVKSFEEDFVKAWDANDVDGWKLEAPPPSGGPSSDAISCADCEKEFKNENVYKAHLTGKKHIRAAELRAARQGEANGDSDRPVTSASSTLRLKERAIAEREYRVKRLAAAMSQERSDTRVNVERKQGMTERERQMELDALFAESTSTAPQNGDSDSDSDDDEKIYNPLKLPLAWDGKPIPFWLYKLHGLGVEFRCEICGNYVYMGRRAFDKHFNEARHIYGLKCLGITNTTLFREITDIADAEKLWEKIQRDKKKHKVDEGSVVQMEDAEGNVMPEKVYYDLQKQGLL